MSNPSHSISRLRESELLTQAVNTVITREDLWPAVEREFRHLLRRDAAHDNDPPRIKLDEVGLPKVERGS